MESIAGATAQVAIATEAFTGAIKDTTGAQLINKTLDKLNTGTALSGAVVNPDQQFQKDVLNGMGIGANLDSTV